MLKLRKNRKGFTLIELIVVIAILAILAIIAVPRLAGFTDKAKEANDKELASIVAHSIATLIASGDIKVDADGGTVVIDNTATEILPLLYSSADGVTKTSTDVAVTLKTLLDQLVGDDKLLQRADTATITVQSDGDVPVNLITYDWVR